MSVYHFANNSLIDEVTVRRTEGGGTRAYLHACETCTHEQLETIKKALTARSMQWTPIHEDGKPVLEVRGFGRHESDLLKILSEKEAVIGGYKKLPTVGDEISFKDKFRKNTLRATGLGYFIGDISYLSYGWKEARDMHGKWVKPQSLAAGIFYALGSPFMTFFGQGDKSDIQLKHLAYTMKNELEKQQIDVPQDSSVRAVANGHNSTVWKKFLSFSQRYPAEITNGIFAGAGSMIIWEKIKDLKTFDWAPMKAIADKARLATRSGGWKAGIEVARGEGKAIKAFLNNRTRKPGQTAHDPYSVLMDIGLGSLTVLAGLVSVFVEEKVRKPDEPKKKGLARVWQWIEEKPLRTAGYLLMGATTAHAFSTWKDYKYVKSTSPSSFKGQKDEAEAIWERDTLESALPRRAIFVGSNLAAEALMSVSSKGHGAGVISDRSLDRSAYAVAADLVRRTPEEKRDMVLEHITRFLADKEILGGRPEQHVEGIKEQLSDICRNPWAGPVSSVCAMPEPSERKEDGRWRNRIAASQMAVSAASPAL